MMIHDAREFQVTIARCFSALGYLGRGLVSISLFTWLKSLRKLCCLRQFCFMELLVLYDWHVLV